LFPVMKFKCWGTEDVEAIVIGNEVVQVGSSNTTGSAS
jgi:hypothetical protein